MYYALTAVTANSGDKCSKQTVIKTVILLVNDLISRTDTMMNGTVINSLVYILLARCNLLYQDKENIFINKKITKQIIKIINIYKNYINPFLMAYLYVMLSCSGIRLEDETVTIINKLKSFQEIASPVIYSFDDFNINKISSVSLILFNTIFGSMDEGSSGQSESFQTCKGHHMTHLNSLSSIQELINCFSSFIEYTAVNMKRSNVITIEKLAVNKDVFYHILNFLQIKTICMISCVNRTFRYSTSSNQLWHGLYCRRYPIALNEIILCLNNNKKCKNCFIIKNRKYNFHICNDSNRFHDWKELLREKLVLEKPIRGNFNKKDGYFHRYCHVPGCTQLLTSRAAATVCRKFVFINVLL